MEEMVQNMLEYKSKIDQLKQEKSSLSITYEVINYARIQRGRRGPDPPTWKITKI